MVNEYAAAAAAAARYDYTPGCGKWMYRGHGASNLRLQDKSPLSLLATSVPARRARNARWCFSLCPNSFPFFFSLFFCTLHRPAACQIAHVNAPLSSLLSFHSPLSRSRRFSYLRPNDRPVVSSRRDIYPNEERVKSCCRTSQPADCANHEGIRKFTERTVLPFV